jgi:hypothetical protein
VLSSKRGHGFSNAARIVSDFSQMPPADSHQPLSPSSPRPFAAPRPPHPAAKRFVQSAFLIGFAMRKALSVCGIGYSTWLKKNRVAKKAVTVPMPVNPTPLGNCGQARG